AAALALAQEQVDVGPLGAPHRTDIDLLLSESQRCRTILAELSSRPESGELPQRVPIGALIETAAAPYPGGGVRRVIEAAAAPTDGGAVRSPQAAHRPELIHGLGNLLQNAIEFARSEARVMVRWTDRDIRVVIQDDGPGFAPGLLGQIGEPYLSGGV